MSENDATPTASAGTLHRGTRRGAGWSLAWARTVPTLSAASRRRISCQRVGSVDFMGGDLQ